METQNSLSISESIKFGFNQFFQNKLFLLGFLAISFLIGLPLDFIPYNSKLIIPLEFLINLITLYLSYGFLKGLLEVIDNKKPTLKILTQTSPNTFLRYLVLIIAITLISLVGLLLGLLLSGIISYAVLQNNIPEIINLAQNGTINQFSKIPHLAIMLVALIIITLIPIIYLNLRFAVAELVFVDSNFKTIQSLQESNRLTNNHKLKIFLFWIVLALFNIAGFLCLLIGLLVTIPASGLAAAHFYRSLKNLQT